MSRLMINIVDRDNQEVTDFEACFDSGVLRVKIYRMPPPRPRPRRPRKSDDLPGQMLMFDGIEKTE